MIKFRLLIAGSFIFLIASGQSAKTPTTTAKKNNNTVSSKFGKWEQDEQGNKYREDYALRDLLRGSELVKYTRINGGQYGGGSSTTKFTLCSDGSLKYYHQSLTTVSVMVPVEVMLLKRRTKEHGRLLKMKRDSN